MYINYIIDITYMYDTCTCVHGNTCTCTCTCKYNRMSKGSEAVTCT